MSRKLLKAKPFRLTAHQKRLLAEAPTDFAESHLRAAFRELHEKKEAKRLLRHSSKKELVKETPPKGSYTPKDSPISFEYDKEESEDYDDYDKDSDSDDYLEDKPLLKLSKPSKKRSSACSYPAFIRNSTPKPGETAAECKARVAETKRRWKLFAERFGSLAKHSVNRKSSNVEEPEDKEELSPTPSKPRRRRISKKPLATESSSAPATPAVSVIAF